MDQGQLEERIAEAVGRRLASLLKELTEATAVRQPEYLSIRSAAALADLSYDHVRRAVERGELPASDKGNGKKHVYRIARPDFDRWMQKGKGGKHLPPRTELKDKMSRYLPGVDG
jgi:excisionase family DNA binding protein